MAETPTITIPQALLPKDGRFGSGPAKIRDESLRALYESGHSLLGTSHRKPPVKSLVQRLRTGIASLLSLPDGYEVVLANGGTTIFWDTMIFGLIRQRSQHLSFGEFSGKFARHATNVPFLDQPEVITTVYGTHPHPVAREEIDTYALTHNETSTGVATQIKRPAHEDGRVADGLVVVDATSAAGGLFVDPAEFDCYYFAPQKCLAADGGLWIAAMSPAALERAGEIDASGRWIPEAIRLSTAIANSPLNQTYNTLAVATVFLAVQQVEWLNNNGGLHYGVSRTNASSEILYSWAEARDYTTPYVADPSMRSRVVGTIDLVDEVDAKTVVNVLIQNGIVDTNAYGKLDRNQLRIAMFPAIEPDDVAALTQCVDYVVERLA